MTSMVNPILFYHPDGYGMARKDIKGRHSAGEGFLSAFLAQTPHTEVHALCSEADHFKSFAQVVADSGRRLQARHVARADIAAMQRQGMINLPDPMIGQEAIYRGFAGETSYAISGVTHTISSRAILEAIAGLCVAPLIA